MQRQNYTKNKIRLPSVKEECLQQMQIHFCNCNLYTECTIYCTLYNLPTNQFSVVGMSPIQVEVKIDPIFVVSTIKRVPRYDELKKYIKLPTRFPKNIYVNGLYSSKISILYPNLVWINKIPKNGCLASCDQNPSMGEACLPR